MLPLFSRLPAAGPRQAPFSGRLLAAASLLLVVLSVALALPATASAHTATASAHTATASAGAYAWKSKPCLHITFWIGSGLYNRGNAAYFNFSIINKCGFAVNTIRARWSLVSLCKDTAGDGVFIGDVDRAGNFPVPNLAAGASNSVQIVFRSYCIQCKHGLMTFPQFTIDASIVGAAGFRAQNSPLVATMGPDGRHGDIAILLNDAHDSGGKNCFGGNGELPSL